MNQVDSKAVARQRWDILRSVLVKKTKLKTPEYSSRRHNDLSLFNVQELPQKHDRKDTDMCKSYSWQQYTQEESGYSVVLKKSHSLLSKQDLQVQDNTGNICIWASEQVMADYCIQNIANFCGNSVIEIGGGYSCLAGVFVAKYGNPKRIVLSDGNLKAIENVKSIVDQNGLIKTDVVQLCWDDIAILHKMTQQFDYVLCSDCLFQDAHRENLANAMFQLLKPGGEAIIFAPKRGNTFDKFVTYSKQVFGELNAEAVHNYNEKMTMFHCSKKSDKSYNEDLHYPLLLKLKKSDKLDYILPAADYA